ncbi:MAG TPA: excisionase family DNA-binding protein [Planctomicrobium sp.]|nr:excisionase family DNA-binding protein [Planctomicrobium sp.]
MVTATIREPFSPTDDDRRLAEESTRMLSPFRHQKLSVQIPKTGEQVELPAIAVRMLLDLLSEMAAGNPVTLIPYHAELTTQQAADLIGVSRPFLVGQLESGVIPFHMVGTHRRVRFSDLMNYKRDMDQKRLETLQQLSAESQELDTY